ncbi:MAG: DNA mismatch repair endonuclease MutL [Phycisphaerae bacterium]|jgi:DNA mismatch repair protein MutL
MGQIRVLPPTLVNRIAAGECVERPSSIVKELIENALDAGASRIDVTILDGGRGLVQVADDGVGMDVDDLRLCVTPHATSKIRVDDDLFNIHTMGFRGEALPSIGAVSRLEIVSRRRDSDVGHRIRVDAGDVGEPEPCAAPPGTTVSVHDLFYCVPARRKFLRTNQTEMGHVTEQFARIALPHPAVALTLSHQQREMHRLGPSSDARQRIADFYGPELAGTLLSVQRDSGGVHVEGLVAPPEQCRKSSKWEYVFVNGRYVRDRFVTHAVREAYRSLLQPDQHPVVFLFITIDPAAVDANVHPTKVEVRWRDANYVHGQVLAALREKFLSTNLDRGLRPAPPADNPYRQRVREAMVDFFTRSQPAAGAPVAAPAAPPRATSPTPEHFGEQPVPPPTQHPVAPPTQPEPVATPEMIAPEPRPARAVQIHNTYLVVETDEGLMIIDQHALHERILYEELRQRLTEQPLEAQRLLIPEVVAVPADRLEILETHADTLRRLGLVLEAAGPRSVALHAFPLLLERLEPAAFVRDLMDLLSEVGRRPDTESLVHSVLDMMACKAAVKAGDPLTDDEIRALLARRDVAERSSHCPHGRPTTLRLSLRDLERQFKRS